MIDKNFWANKKVLVTGCTGFKGSWLVTWLIEMGAEVSGYSLAPPTNPSMFEILNLSDKITYQEGDIRNYDNFFTFLNKVNPEIVFHLAAQPLVRYSYDNPIETYQTNVLGVVNILEAIRHNKNVKAVVNVTTDKCYENKEWLWGYRENEPMGGFDPYSNSKGCSELVTSCYQNSYFNPKDYKIKHTTLLASARAGNVIGGGDWALDRLIPDIIKSFLSNKVVMIRNPLSIRPWQHVLEPLSGYHCLAQRLFNGEKSLAEAWDFGPNDIDARNVGYIVKTLCDSWGDGVRFEIDKEVHPHEARYLKLDCAKANNVLEWYPRFSLDKALNKIIDWYKSYNAGDDMYKVTVSQIYEYININEV